MAGRRLPVSCISLLVNLYAKNYYHVLCHRIGCGDQMPAPRCGYGLAVDCTPRGAGAPHAITPRTHGMTEPLPHPGGAWALRTAATTTAYHRPTHSAGAMVGILPAPMPTPYHAPPLPDFPGTPAHTPGLCEP